MTSATTTSVSSNELSDGDVRTLHAPSCSDDDSQVVLSVQWHGGSLGAAYYEVTSSQMYLLPDTEDPKQSLHVLTALLRQVQPNMVLVSSKLDHMILETIKKSEFLDSPENAEDDNPDLYRPRIVVLPSCDFNVELCRRRLLHLSLPTMKSHFTDTEREVHLSSLIPLHHTSMVQAGGALIKYIEKMRIGVELEDDTVRTPVLAIHTFSLKNLLVVNDNTYCALQIFNTRHHPSAYKKWSGREGLSLYGIMNRCNSKVGAVKLRQWFLQPSQDLSVLTERQTVVEFFLQSHCQEVVHAIQGCLKHVQNLAQILNRMSRQDVSLGDFKNLYKTAYNAIHVADVCRAQPLRSAIFKKIGDVFNSELHTVASLINRIVDFDESAAQERFVVKPNIDSDLDEKKRTYNGLPDFMTRIAEEELSRLDDDITECNVIYLPQLGYLLVIPLTPRMIETEDFSLDSLQFQFVSNNVVHYKSASTVELDRMLGDIQCEIKDIETAILHKLQSAILEHTSTLLHVVDCCAELDCLLALASCAKEYNYTRPEMTRDTIIHITAGRHPLQEKCCNLFVPNDTLNGGNQGKMKILTGPNASGKSVYLKQVGLIVFLAHIGSFVPADAATIGVCDEIFTRIQSVQTVSDNLSSFMTDLNQVSRAVCCATERSLVLLDEFGKSTRVEDGVALLCSSLAHWLNRTHLCPHVFVSTHFHSIIQQKLLPVSNQLKFQTLDVEMEGDELVFLYQLVEGHTVTSHACHTAAQAGLPDEIVSRGIEVSELMSRHQPVHRVDRASTQTLHTRCKMIVSRFLDLDEEQDDVEKFLTDFVLPVYEGTLNV